MSPRSEQYVEITYHKIIIYDYHIIIYRFTAQGWLQCLDVSELSVGATPANFYHPSSFPQTQGDVSQSGTG